jgi:hypothetical protein
MGRPAHTEDHSGQTAGCLCKPDAPSRHYQEHLCVCAIFKASRLSFPCYALIGFPFLSRAGRDARTQGDIAARLHPTPLQRLRVYHPQPPAHLNPLSQPAIGGEC